MERQMQRGIEEKQIPNISEYVAHEKYTEQVLRKRIEERIFFFFLFIVRECHLSIFGIWAL
jgi:hypothetical protein